MYVCVRCIEVLLSDLPLSFHIGGSHHHLAKEAKRFFSFKQQCVADKKREPQGEGVLIFDEVKVINVEFQKPETYRFSYESRGDGILTRCLPTGE